MAIALSWNWEVWMGKLCREFLTCAVGKKAFQIRSSVRFSEGWSVASRPRTIPSAHGPDFPVSAGRALEPHAAATSRAKVKTSCLSRRHVPCPPS